MAPSAVSPPPLAEPVKTRSILRKRSYEPSSEPDPNFNSTKRARFVFDPVPDVVEQDPQDAAILREEVAFAIKNRNDHSRDRYEEIKQYFDEPLDSEDAVSSTSLRLQLVAITSNVPLLKTSCSDLVTAMIKHPWLGRDDAFVATFTRFLGHLVSAHGGYLYPVLKMLVENFAHISTSAPRYTNIERPSRSRLQSRVHSALRYILQLIPSASSTLSTILSHSFPFFADSHKSHVSYVRNLLRLTEYAPEIKPAVLDLTIERTLKIDTQVQGDVEDLVGDVDEILLSQRSTKSVEFDDSDDTGSDSSDDEDDVAIDEERRKKTIKSSLDKMDSILDILFQFYDPSVFPPKECDNSDNSSSFNQLLVQFRKSILPTYQSRHPQFLLFHFAQASPECASSFVDTCLQILADKSRFPVIRVSAVSYLASFIARSTKTEKSLVLYVFNALARCAERLRKAHEPGCRLPDLRKYSPYYATVQAIVYIFCFRWRDFVIQPSGRTNSNWAAQEDNDDEDEDEDIDAILLDGSHPLTFDPFAKEVLIKNFNSRLNPLKVCSPIIIEMFAKVAHHLNFMYIYPTLEANKRIRLSKPLISDSGRETSLAGERSCQLDAYFPFDPYYLPKSKRWLAGEYRNWTNPPGMRDEEFGVEVPDDEDDDMSADDDDDLQQQQAVAVVDGENDNEVNSSPPQRSNYSGGNLVGGLGFESDFTDSDSDERKS